MLTKDDIIQCSKEKFKAMSRKENLALARRDKLYDTLFEIFNGIRLYDETKIHVIREENKVSICAGDRTLFNCRTPDQKKWSIDFDGPMEFSTLEGIVDHIYEAIKDSVNGEYYVKVKELHDEYDKEGIKYLNGFT